MRALEILQGIALFIYDFIRNFFEKMQKETYRQRFVSMMILPCALFYYEIVFSLSTTRMIFRTRAWFFTLLFSISSGLFEYLFSSISKNRNLNRYMKMIWLFATAFPFGVEYFVYKQFNQFYDLRTVLHGAGGVFKDFFSTVLRLMFSPSGLLHLLLFLLPFILYCWKGRLFDTSRKIGMKFRIRVIAGMFGIFLFTLLCIVLSGTYRPVYGSRYTFDGSVKSFGLATSIRKEVERMATGKGKKASFEMGVEEEEEPVRQMTDSGEPQQTDNAAVTQQAADPAAPAQTQDSAASQQTAAPGASVQTSEMPKSFRTAYTPAPKSENAQTAEPTPTPVPVPEYNVMDIDFEELAEKDHGEYADIDRYVNSLKPSRTNEYTGLFRGKNLIFFTAEAFSGYMIDERLTPTLYRLATKGIQFNDFYQPSIAGTTGGEVQNLFGILAMDGGASMVDLAEHNNYFTMGSQLDRLGYWGKAYHNNDYTFYDRDKTHDKLGYSNGYMAVGTGMEKYLSESMVSETGLDRGEIFPASDLEMVRGTFEEEYGDKAPFNIYYMTFSGHSSYTIEENDMTYKHWKEVEGLPFSEPVKAYIACNLELEAALTWLVDELEARQMADDTVIVISPDHYPYGLANLTEDAEPVYLEELYGHAVNTQMKMDENRLIIWSGCLEDKEPIVVNDPTFSLDILPTLSNLFGLEWDSRLLPGRDALSEKDPLVFNAFYDWRTDIGTYVYSTGTFEPRPGVTEVPDDYVEKMNRTVSNKIEFCRCILYDDYYGHVMQAKGPQKTVGPKDDT